MISPRSIKSSPIGVPKGGERPIYAYSDPTIFRSERVLRNLMSREMKLVPTTATASTTVKSVQTDLKPGMRREVASWMLEVCEEEGCQAQVFCLAINYLDRFLDVCNIRRNQLQLLGAVCLLVSLKVRAHSIISAQKLIQFTDYTVTLEDLLEWEFLLLSKLDWDLSAVIAPDFVEHILQRLTALNLPANIEATRRNAETLIYMCYSEVSLASYPPSLIAVSSVLTTLRPVLENSSSLLRDTPSPSCSSSSSTTSSPPAPTRPASSDPLDTVIEAVERLTLTERALVLEVMEKLEELMRASLPPSPLLPHHQASTLPPSPCSTSDEEKTTSSPLHRRSSSFPQLALKSLYPETEPSTTEIPSSLLLHTENMPTKSS